MIANITDMDDVEQQRLAGGKSYLEFVRVASMSAGVYALAAGGEDAQTPHLEDELYYVLRGKARFRAGEDDQAVKTGSLIFVAANVVHRFYEITEDLQVLVFFAPAETL
jgi:quercetin dioxygenase-like cupin family protein